MEINTKIYEILTEMRARCEAYCKPCGEEIFFHGKGGAMRALMFYPNGIKPEEEKLPLYLHIHGGGFVMNKAESLGRGSQELADRLNIIVCSVAYRLAPEFPYPADKEDAFDTAVYLYENAEKYGINREKIVIGGHSSGGNIACGTALMAVKAGKQLFSGMILDYAPLDISRSESEKTGLPPKCFENTDIEISAFYNNCYCTAEQSKESICSPLFATAEELSALPPALMLIGSEDSLVQENVDFMLKLRDADVKVDFHLFAGAGHGFSMHDPVRGPLARGLIDQFLQLHLF